MRGPVLDADFVHITANVLAHSDSVYVAREVEGLPVGPRVVDGAVSGEGQQGGEEEEEGRWEMPVHGNSVWARFLPGLLGLLGLWMGEWTHIVDRRGS